MTSAALRILLLDDHQLFRSGLRLLLEREPGLSVVGEAADGTRALALALDTRPDIAVVDVHLEAEDGIAVAARLLASVPATKIIFLSSDANIAVVRRALEAGGSGYLLKDEAPQDLVRALHAAAKGGVYLPPEIASSVLKDYRRRDPGQTSSAPAGPEPLSTRELEVLRLTADGLRNKEIADRLKISPKSVETYRSRLLKKLGYSSTAELVRHAIREGLIAP